jgi:hypothetical protein
MRQGNNDRRDQFSPFFKDGKSILGTITSYRVKNGDSFRTVHGMTSPKRKFDSANEKNRSTSIYSIHRYYKVYRTHEKYLHLLIIIHVNIIIYR